MMLMIGPWNDWSMFQVSFMLCALWRWARWAWGLMGSNAGSTHYGEN
jgi:hypothetical protein